MQPPSQHWLSVVIPTIDETRSLAETVETLFASSPLEILEVLLVVCERTTLATLDACACLKMRHAGKVEVIYQSIPRLGGAFRAGIAAARGTHIVLMFADLESDPKLVPSLASLSRLHPDSIVSASRWLKGGGFHGYGPVKLVLNRCFQWLCASACRCSITDFTYGFRLYPSRLLAGNDWTESGHPFVLETLVGPILSQVPVVEVPAVWHCRSEGRMHNRLGQYCRYLPALLRILIRSDKRFAKLQRLSL